MRRKPQTSDIGAWISGLRRVGGDSAARPLWAMFAEGSRQRFERLAGFCVGKRRKQHDLGRGERRKSEPLADLDRAGRLKPAREGRGGEAGGDGGGDRV